MSVKYKKNKVYCILFDTMPLMTVINKMLKDNGMNMFSQVGGCFTIVSLLEMFTGNLPSDYVINGIGHSYLNRYRKKKSKKIYVPWYDDFIMSKLSKNEWKIRCHDLPTDNFVHGDIHTDSWDGGHEKRLNIFKKYKSIRDGGRTVDNLLLTNNKKSREWHKREHDFIRSIQNEKPKNNTFYFIDYEHFHSLSGYKKGKSKSKVNRTTDIVVDRIMNLLDVWDFNEQNSIFWLFADHGFPSEISRASIIPKTNSYLSWVFIKDNINIDNLQNSNSGIISIRDFMPSIMKKFNYDYKETSESYSILKDIDKDRIYFIEDGRKAIDEIKSTTAVCCKVVEWDGNRPVKILQVGYFSKKKIYEYSLNILNKDGFFVEVVKLHKKDNKYMKELDYLKNKLIKRFKWVK